MSDREKVALSLLHSTPLMLRSVARPLPVPICDFGRGPPLFRTHVPSLKALPCLCGPVRCYITLQMGCSSIRLLLVYSRTVSASVPSLWDMKAARCSSFVCSFLPDGQYQGGDHVPSLLQCHSLKQLLQAEGPFTPDSGVVSVVPRTLLSQSTVRLSPPSPFFSLCLFLGPAVGAVVLSWAQGLFRLWGSGPVPRGAGMACPGAAS